MEKKPMFYGGKVGPWIPVLLMLAGMLASTIIGGGGLNRLTGISFFAISVGFLLCKDKKQFGKSRSRGCRTPCSARSSWPISWPVCSPSSCVRAV